MKKFLSVLALLFFSANLFAQDAKPLPDISILDANGNKINIRDVGHGKIVLLDFWATWCIPCKKELATLQELYTDWKKEYNVEIVTVSIDDSKNMSKVKAYADGQAWEYTILLDPNQDLLHALNFQNIPTTFIIDANGNIISQHTGYVEGDENVLEEEIKKLAGK